jgi:plastocyanin
VPVKKASISIVNFAFVPATLNVSPGTLVTVTNNDTVTHTWSSLTGVWNSGALSPGQSYSFMFTKAGTYDYECMIHTFMTGTVIVS